jgi:very-short-patch-repair endonuclease
VQASAGVEAAGQVAWGQAMRAERETVVRARRLRRDLSLPEVVLWDCLRGRRLGGLRFRRQHPVGPYVLDFYCAESALAIEVDGAQHDLPGQMEHDRRRDARQPSTRALHDRRPARPSTRAPPVNCLLERRPATGSSNTILQRLQCSSSARAAARPCRRKGMHLEGTASVMGVVS